MFDDRETLRETIVYVFAHNTHEDVSFVALFFIFFIGY
jgi:hypothetical protein